jgi:hypothetical protein
MSTFISGRNPLHKTWLTGVIPFVEIGWKRGTKRLETVWKAAKKFQHLLHRKRGAAENSCAICKGTLHRDLEELVTGTVNRAASKQVKSTDWKIAHLSCQ